MCAVTAVTSLGFQTTQWSVKWGVSDDFRHYCDELEARLDTVVVERPVGLIWHGNDRMHHSGGPCLVVGIYHQPTESSVLCGATV